MPQEAFDVKPLKGLAIVVIEVRQSIEYRWRRPYEASALRRAGDIALTTSEERIEISYQGPPEDSGLLKHMEGLGFHLRDISASIDADGIPNRIMVFYRVLIP